MTDNTDDIDVTSPSTSQDSQPPVQRIRNRFQDYPYNLRNNTNGKVSVTKSKKRSNSNLSPLKNAVKRNNSRQIDTSDNESDGNFYCMSTTDLINLNSKTDIAIANDLVHFNKTSLTTLEAKDMQTLINRPSDKDLTPLPSTSIIQSTSTFLPAIQTVLGPMEQLGLGMADLPDNPIFDKLTEVMNAKPNYQTKSPVPKPRLRNVSKNLNQEIIKSKSPVNERMGVTMVTETSNVRTKITEQTSIINVLRELSSKIDKLDTDMNEFKTSVMEKLNKMEGNIRNKGDITEMEILVQEKEITNKTNYNNIKDKVTKIENLMSGLAETKEPIPHRAIEQAIIPGNFREEIREQNQIQEKRLNLVVQNFPEKDNLTEDLEEINVLIATALDLPIRATDCIRLGEKKLPDAENNDMKPRILKIAFPVLEDRSKVLAKARELKESENPIYKDVYIRPDLTKKQMHVSKNLRINLKLIREKYPGRTWTIRGGRILETSNVHPNDDLIKITNIMET